MIWIVWEHNSIVPKVFKTEALAYEYRTARQRKVRHQVYIAPGELEGDDQ